MTPLVKHAPPFNKKKPTTKVRGLIKPGNHNLFNNESGDHPQLMMPCICGGVFLFKGWRKFYL
jgi:hypothetical protein